MNMKKRNILYIALCTLAVFLFVSRFQMAITALLAMVLVWIMVQQNSTTLRLNALSMVYIVTVLLCVISACLVHFPGFSAFGSAGYAFKEIARCIIYFLITQILMRMTVNTRVYMWLWEILLAVTVLIAILQFTKTLDVNTMLKSFYGDSVQFNSAERTQLSSFRCGSVFINPNVFACFLVAVLGSYMVVTHEIKVLLFNSVFMYALCIVGIILSGSRTGFVLCLVIILYGLFVEAKHDIKYAGKLLISLMLGLVALVLLLQLCGIDMQEELANLRMFKLQEGVSNSFSIKLDIFWNLVNDMHIGNLLFGYGPFDYTVSGDLLVDFDFGYFLVFFGSMGLVLYVALICGILFYENGNKSRLRMFAMISLLFGFTAGAYFNLRIFMVYLLMFLPLLTDTTERKH